LCYNGAAVERGLKLEQGVKPINASGAAEAKGIAEIDAPSSDFGVAPANVSIQTQGEDASRFCPVCSRRLQSRRCKLICDVCGYYMSCADYY
jgi:hypothetical protein